MGERVKNCKYGQKKNAYLAKYGTFKIVMK